MDIQFRDVLFFDKMITPKIITWVYWLLLALIIIGGIGTMFVSFLGGLLSMAAGLVFARVWCELMMLFFKINESVRRIADAQAGVVEIDSDDAITVEDATE